MTPRRPHRTAWALPLAAAILLPLAGCQHKLYDWGSYDQSIRTMSEKKDGQFDPHKEADRLAKEIEATRGKNLKVPPGKYAHLGYLYYLSGSTAESRSCFIAEKNEFPESAPFMDFMIARLPQ